MTSPTPPPDQRPHPTLHAALQRLPLRLLTAWALVALAAVSIGFGFLGWVFPSHPDAALDRFQPGAFTSVPVLAAPLLAVLVALRLGPVLDSGRLVAVLAMLEYAAALALGTLALLVSLATRFDSLAGGIYALGGVIGQFGDIAGTVLRLGLLALALVWVYRLFGDAGGRLPGLDTGRD